MKHTHIILLRGVMPTGKNKVPMAQLREITLETITVDDFDTHELRSAAYYDKHQPGNQSSRAAA